MSKFNDVSVAQADDGKWFVLYADGGVVACDDEETACEIQREWRMIHGVDPITGDATGDSLYDFALRAAHAHVNSPMSYDFYLRKMREEATPERIVALFKKLQEVEFERDSYRKAKAENDERYLTERETWRLRAERAESEEHYLRMTNGYLALDVERAMKRAERAEDDLARLRSEKD